MNKIRVTISVLAVVGGLLMAPGALLAATADVSGETSGTGRFLTAWEISDALTASVPTWRPELPAGMTAGAIALGDLNGDGLPETVVASAAGEAPQLAVYHADGRLWANFPVYTPGMRYGVTLAVGDLNGDRLDEIVTGTGPGAPGHVLVYDLEGRIRLIPGGLFPFGSEQRGGVNLAIGDMDGDGQGEIIAGSGPGEPNRVSIWRPNAVAPLADFNPFADASTVVVGETYVNASTAGVSLAVGDFDGNRQAEIAVALATESDPLVRLFSVTDGTANLSGQFVAIGNGFRGGLNLAAADVNADGRSDILSAPNTLGGPHVHAYDHFGQLLTHFFAYDEPYRGGVLLAGFSRRLAGPVYRTTAYDGSGAAVSTESTENPADIAESWVVTAPAERHMSENRPYLPQFIKISTREQRLYAYEYGRLARSFLVSTGEYATPTPVGEFSVLAKPYEVHYTWNYGPDDARNYDLGLVPFNLRFYPHIYIHYAPWHNNFGHRMSHGCVNVDRTNAEWIYDWADIGSTVVVKG